MIILFLRYIKSGEEEGNLRNIVVEYVTSVTLPSSGFPLSALPLINVLLPTLFGRYPRGPRWALGVDLSETELEGKKTNA